MCNTKFIEGKTRSMLLRCGQFTFAKDDQPQLLNSTIDEQF